MRRLAGDGIVVSDSVRTPCVPRRGSDCARGGQVVSREALERLVLSALLQGSTAPLAVADGVQPQDFAAGPLRAIADAVYGLLNAGWRDRDRVAAVAAQLAQQGRLEEVGGVAELAVLAAGTAPDEAVERASAELIRRTDLERLADAAGCIAVAALAGDNPEKAWLASERALFEAIPRSARWEGPRRAKVLAYPAFAKIEWGQARLRGEHPIGPTLFPFGIRSLDERCEGLAGEELTLVLAPRGWARAIVHQAALAAASIARRRVIVAGDEPPTEFVSRALAWLGGTAAPVRARGELKAGALDRLVDGASVNKAPPGWAAPPITCGPAGS
ncbi:MAG: hypothetical protein FIB01_07555 [Gemmatimonadetes bacterium]|nr:hypothetical protein [Gemmatimonadota bacterium]